MSIMDSCDANRSPCAGEVKDRRLWLAKRNYLSEAILGLNLLLAQKQDLLTG